MSENKMMRISGRSTEGLAKAIMTDTEGKPVVNLSGSKHLIYKEFNIDVDETGTWKTHPVNKSFNATQLEIVIVARDLNRNFSIAPVFGTRIFNFKPTISGPSEYIYAHIGEPVKRESAILIPAIGDFLNAIQIKSDDYQQTKVDIFIYETQPNTTSVNGAYIFHTLTAGKDYQSVKFNVSTVVFITNDGTEDIIIAFNRFDTAQHKIILKAGESINNLSLSCQKLFYQSISGNQPLRAMGVR